jgi:CheY-like chemotaxis protein
VFGRQATHFDYLMKGENSVSDTIRRLIESLRSLGVLVAWAESGQSAVSDVMKHTPLGVIIDENLLDMTGFDLVRRLLPINALINTVVISDLPPETFHEASEGLGILAQLSLKPTPSDARAILARLKRMSPSGLAFPRT